MSESETISLAGEQYEFYAGPFHSVFDAYDFVDARIEQGVISEREAVVDHATGKVYRLVVAPPLSPE